jgi:dienelactone hydrolase
MRSMVKVLMLHSALGLRDGVLAMAERLSDLGHHVVTPDYYDGRIFDNELEGVAYRDQVGSAELFDRVCRHLDGLPAATALVGFSLGASFAQRLAYDRPAAHCVVLLHHASGPTRPWRGQPVQVHRYEQDKWIDPSEVDALHRAVRSSGAAFEDFVTAGEGHLFTDPDLPDHDAGASERTLDRMARLLAR